MVARMFTIGGRREQLDEFARVGEEKILPVLQRFDGFGGSWSSLTNRMARYR